MRVSVIVVTVRPGGLDVLLTGLAHQEFEDFEVVLVDGLYHRRRELVADKFAQARIRLVHTPPRLHNFPEDSCPQYRNAAIAKARGELLVWLCDYSFLPSVGLREHWGVWEAFGWTTAGMGAHRYVFPPEVSYKLPEYAPMKRFTPSAESGATYGYSESDANLFAEDVRQGVYDTLMYSVFHPPLEAPEQIKSLRDDPYFFMADPKLRGIVGGIVPPTAFHAKNESVGMKDFLAVNGFDECWIGHCYDDSDAGLRLSRVGAKWMLLDPAATVLIVNPRHFYPQLVRRESPGQSLAAYRRRESDPSCIISDNNYSLERVRELPWWY